MYGRFLGSGCIASVAFQKSPWFHEMKSHLPREMGCKNQAKVLNPIERVILTLGRKRSIYVPSSVPF